MSESETKKKTRISPIVFQMRHDPKDRKWLVVYCCPNVPGFKPTDGTEVARVRESGAA